MRALIALLYNLLAFLGALLLWPLRRVARKPFVLAVELKGDTPWREAPRRRLPFTGRRKPLQPDSLKLLEDRLALAARDPMVRGVVIKVEGFDGPGVKLTEVARMVARLREAGKEVHFYGRAVTMREYALMSGGTRVWLAPGGRVDLKGYSAELVVAGETLRRFGINAHFVRRGRFKTAPELFTDAEVSQAQRETTEAILDEAFSHAVKTIAEGRGRSEAEVRRWVDEGPYTSARALSAGLIDAVGDGEDVEQAFETAPGQKPPLVAIGHYRGPALLSWPRYRPLRLPPRVGLVQIQGTIKLGESSQMPLAPQAAGSDSVAVALRRAREDASLKAVVLAIDSRGGSSLASELILRAVRRLAEKKPVVAFIDGVAASGGYMAALGAAKIVISPTALTGSIGVFGGKFEASSLLDRLGVGRAIIRKGERATLESPMGPWSEAARAAIDREIDEIYRDFLKQVADARKMTVERAHELAEGRVYTGRKAHSLGLVDELGGFEDAVRLAASRAKLTREPQGVRVSTPSHPLQALAGPRRGAAIRELFLPLSAERVFALAEWWMRIDPLP